MSRDAVLDAIRGADRLTFICHENPDADTLGSALARCSAPLPAMRI